MTKDAAAVLVSIALMAIIIALVRRFGYWRVMAVAVPTSTVASLIVAVML